MLTAYTCKAIMQHRSIRQLRAWKLGAQHCSLTMGV